jgi:type IV pilus assembly protein PilA
MKRQQGFSLIELLVVVAIILIIAAIAIPNLMQSRYAANESAAVSALRVIDVSMTSYQATYPDTGYATQLADLGDGGAVPCAQAVNSACMIDSALETGTKSGYNFVVVGLNGLPNTQYLSVATPVSGNRSFCSVEDGVIRVDPTGGAIPDYATCVALSPIG